MPADFDIIRARIKDDAPVLIDKLMRASQKKVVLVLPKNSLLAVNQNSLKLIKQEAESVGKDLVVIAQNGKIKSFAEKSEIPFYETLADFSGPAPLLYSAPRNSAPRKMMDIMPPKMPAALPEPEAEPPKAMPSVLSASRNDALEKNLENFYKDEGRRVPKIKGPRKTLSFRGLVFFAVASSVLLVVAALFLLLPKAYVSVVARKRTVTAKIPVVVSKNAASVSVSSGILPGQLIAAEKSGSKTVNVSGEKEEVSLKASGFITIYNAYSAAPQKLVATTRFETKDGKIFRIENPIIVPGAKMAGGSLTPSSIRASVTADVPGDAYNIGPEYFTIPGFKGSPKYAGFYARSFEPMSGGRIGLMPKLTETALTQAKDELQKELFKQIEESSLSSLSDAQDLKLIGGASSVKVDYFKYNLPPGSAADSVTIEMKITVQAIYFREKDLNVLIAGTLSGKYPELNGGNLGFNLVFPVPKADFTKGELSFTLDINENQNFAGEMNILKRELAGKQESEMRSVISSKSFIDSATISLWPFWVRRAPGSPDRIVITLDEN